MMMVIVVSNDCDGMNGKKERAGKKWSASTRPENYAHTHTHTDAVSRITKNDEGTDWLKWIRTSMPTMNKERERERTASKQTFTEGKNQRQSLAVESSTSVIIIKRRASHHRHWRLRVFLIRTQSNAIDSHKSKTFEENDCNGDQSIWMKNRNKQKIQSPFQDQIQTRKWMETKKSLAKLCKEMTTVLTSVSGQTKNKKSYELQNQTRKKFGRILIQRKMKKRDVHPFRYVKLIIELRWYHVHTSGYMNSILETPKDSIKFRIEEEEKEEEFLTYFDGDDERNAWIQLIKSQFLV